MIYFLRCDELCYDVKPGWIKIGTSNLLSRRLKQFRYEGLENITVLGVMDGGHAEEKVVHGRFARLREFREWFSPGAELLEFITDKTVAWDGVDNLAPVKIDRSLIMRARVIADDRGMTLAEYLTERLAPVVHEDLAQEVSRRMRQ